MNLNPMFFPVQELKYLPNSSFLRGNSICLVMGVEEKLNHHLLTLPVSVRKDMHWNHYLHCLNGNRL